jgi:3-phosphoshikimate 1-carboxyvinyltransferase
VRDQIRIQTAGPLDAIVRPPGSKSITNRALICAGFAAGPSILSGVLDSEDTQVMVAALRQLGLDPRWDKAAAVIELEGCGGHLPVERAELHLANSGTSIRFLTGMLATCRGRFLLDGVPRMRERPIADLLAALQALGAEARSVAGNGCPPVLVAATQGLRGGSVQIRGDVSSQFLSGLLLAAPYAQRDVEIRVEGSLVSQPYIHMTLDVMRAFGVDVVAGDLSRLHVSAPTCYQGGSYAVEPDASAASYFWAAAAILGGQVTVRGLDRDSLQGDVAFCDCLRQMGCQVDYQVGQVSVRGGTLRGIDVDMNAISDTVQTLAAVALFAEGPTTIRGVGHIRHKETDRIGDLARELRKLGALVDELPDGMQITPAALRPAEIETYQDHRMAMSLALVGLRLPGVVINNPGCTAKTYPNFFDDLKDLCGSQA